MMLDKQAKVSEGEPKSKSRSEETNKPDPDKPKLPPAEYPDQLKLVRCLVRSYHRRYAGGLEEWQEYEVEIIKDLVKGRNARLYRSLLGGFILVGGSNYVNSKLWEQLNPKPTYHRIKRELKTANCPRLQSFDEFNGCGYSKYNQTCTEPEHFWECPLPKYPMRFGRLNQMVFSVYLFLRDRCENSFYEFVKSFFGTPSYLKKLEEQELRDRMDGFVAEMSRIYNVGPKLVNMTVSDLFYIKTKGWNYRRVFERMVAVDSLVHQFLHRTGTLELFGKPHKYGQASCHTSDGCVGVIEEISRNIDCKRYNKDYPSYFPRMIQHCIWRFCTESCNLNSCKYDTPNLECEFKDWCRQLPATRPSRSSRKRNLNSRKASKE